MVSDVNLHPYNKGLRKLMETIVKGFSALTDFLMVLVLFVFIFAVLGMQMFGGNTGFQGSRKNFDSMVGTRCKLDPGLKAPSFKF